MDEKNIQIDMPTKSQIVVKSKLLSLDIEFFISFQFDDEKLIAIMMSPNMVLEGRSLNSCYNKIQKALENKLGYPHSYWRSIINLLDPENRLTYWKSNGIKIEHYLFNRFGMEEIISIKL